MAIEELNQKGGLLGRRIEAVVEDGESDEAVFARKAEKLIAQDHVEAVFGCWTSASRKAVKEVIERHDHLLLYPVQFEGLEQSPNIIYLGALPNQQILPALQWMTGFRQKRRWFLVGSDYVFPHAANAIIKDEAKALGCEIAGERYVPLGSAELAAVAREILESRADLILNTLNGDSNVAFFRALSAGGIDSAKTPALSFSISEDELNAVQRSTVVGDYLAGNYFQSIDLPQNRAFLGRFRARFGPDRVVSDAMESAYDGVNLWAQAVQKAGRPDPQAVRAAVPGAKFEGPQGWVEIDPATGMMIQTVRIARIGEAGQLDEVFVSPKPVRPEPYPRSRTRDEWNAFLTDLYKRWGGRWSNPNP
jgi:urea transport system substrate-binding protein